MGNIFVANMSRPSSTVSAVTLAGMGMTLAWEIIMQFGWQPRATLVAASVTFAGALVGYFKRENVLPIQRPDEPEGGV